jgi:hypothetical protein
LLIVSYPARAVHQGRSLDADASALRQREAMLLAHDPIVMACPLPSSVHDRPNCDFDETTPPVNITIAVDPTERPLYWYVFEDHLGSEAS